MVKPMTKEILFMNCMELDFATKVELEHWMATFEEKVWTNDIMKKLSKAGLVRTTAAQVWNKENHRIAQDALHKLQEGERLNGRKTYGVLNKDNEGNKSNPYDVQAGEEEQGRPSFEFVEVPPPELPPKTLIQDQ